MRAPLIVLVCAAAVLAGCGGSDRAGSGSPAASPAASSPAAGTPSPAGTPSRSGTAPPAATAAGETREQRAVRAALVEWYGGQLQRDGRRTCAVMTARARRFYAEGFGGDGVSCERLFGPRGAELFSVGARFSVGAARSARVAIRGDLATTLVLDETQVLRRRDGRWLIDEPVS